MKKLQLAILIVIIVMLSCTQAKKTASLSDEESPQWVNNPYANYPESMYMVGVGTGDTREAAENNAIGSIARVFRSKVRVQQSSFENFLENNAGLQSTSQLRRNTTVGAEEELKNIRIKQTYLSDEGLHYALAVMDRAETAQLYQSEISGNNQDIGDYYLSYKDSKNKLHQYTYLAKCKALSEINEVLQQKLDIISVKRQQMMAPVSNTEINSELQKVLDRITVMLQPDGENAPEVTDYMKELIGKIGFKMVQEAADFTFFYSLTLKPAEMDRNDVTGFNWKLTTSIYDNINNYALKSFNVEKRTLAISDSQAKAKIMRDVRNELTDTLYGQFISYVSSL